MISQRAAFARSQRVLYSHKQASLMLLLLERQCALYRPPIPSFHFPPQFLLVRGPHPPSSQGTLAKQKGPLAHSAAREEEMGHVAAREKGSQRPFPLS